MKRLMVVLAAMVAGFAANAASYTWSTTGRLYDGSGNSGADYYAKDTTAYLLFVVESSENTLTQESLVSSFLKNSSATKATVESSKVATATVSSEGRISASATYDTTSEQTAFFVIFNGDKMYVSNTAGAAYDALNPTDTQVIAFGAQTAASKLSFTSGSFADNGAGWYAASTSPVPEPTSGLLLMLGLCGLALRRCRT